jgi:arylsulfatase A-like enzyme
MIALLRIVRIAYAMGFQQNRFSTWLKLAYAVIALAAVINHSSAAPNIIVIMIDDAGYEDILDRDLIRPNIDQLRFESKVFKNFYTAPMCSPSRLALLTGLNPARLGVQWVFGARSRRGIGTDQQTLVDILNTAGYQTAHFGKWHAGRGQGYSAWDHDFDYVVRSTKGPAAAGYLNPEIEHNDRIKKEYSGGHMTDVLTDQVLDFLSNKTRESQPFFLNLWYHAPHGRYEASDRWMQRYPVKTSYRRFKALFSQLDENIGRIVQFVDSTPSMRENTVIVFTSDNGANNKSRKKNGFFRGYKKDVFEGGIHLPLFVRWPGRIEPGEDSSVLTIVDLLPTISELAGAKAPAKLDGHSFSDIALGTAAERPRPEPLFFMHKVRSDLSRKKLFTPELAQLSWAVLDGDWKLVFEPLDAPLPMLFNWANDIGETQDLAGSEPALVQNMHQDYIRWKSRVSELALHPKVLSESAYFDGKSIRFAAGGSIAYQYDPLQNLNDMDMTFMVDFKLSKIPRHNAVIARKPGVWELRLSPDRQLELKLSSKENKHVEITGSDYQVAAGRRYSVAFTIVGMKRLSNYARLYAREDSQNSFEKIAEGVGVRGTRFNAYAIELGTSKPGQNSIEGTLWNPRLFITPFTNDELPAVRLITDQ